MLSFSLAAEDLPGLIYHRPSGKNSYFVLRAHLASSHITHFCFSVQFCALCPKPWHLKHCWIDGVIRNSSTLKIMPVFWHINSPEISALACFGLSHLILIKGRSLPVLLNFIRSASAWVILLKSSNSLKSFTVMFIDTPLKTKILLFEASAE